jgi:hypothetical protein
MQIIVQSRRHFLIGLSVAGAAGLVGARESLAQDGQTREAATDGQTQEAATNVTWLGMDLKTWLSIIDTALRVVVAVVAGFWAFFLLHHLKQRPRVIAEINERIANTERATAETKEKIANAERETAELKHADARAIAAINESIANANRSQAEIRDIEIKNSKEVKVAVRIHVDTCVSSERTILISTVEITNYGNEATRIKWAGEEAPFTVHFVTFDSDGKTQHGESWSFSVMQTKAPNLYAASHLIRAGTTEYLTFAFQPNRPGLYLLSFRGVVDKDVHADAMKKYNVTLPTSWTAKRYFFVDKVSPERLSPGPGLEYPSDRDRPDRRQR